jgi:hypothetical protein
MCCCASTINEHTKYMFCTREGDQNAPAYCRTKSDIANVAVLATQPDLLKIENIGKVRYFQPMGERDG